MVTPACIRAGASSASTVLPRSTPCWSANEKRTSSSFSFLIACAAALAARACSPVHRPCRSTKLAGSRLREDIAITRMASGEWRMGFSKCCLPYSLLAIRHSLSSIRPRHAFAPPRLGALPIALPIAGRADAVDAGRAGDFLRRRRIEHHHRLAAIARLLERLAQEPPIGADRLVGGAEMLGGAVLDRAHGFASPLVMHVDVGAHAGKGRVFLLVGVKTVIVALVLARHVIR